MGWTWNIKLRVSRVIKYEYMIILFVFLTENIVYEFLTPIKIS